MENNEKVETGPEPNPATPNNRHAYTDKYGSKFVDKTGEMYEKAQARKPAAKNPEAGKQEKKGPPGGFDHTPIPHTPPGYTLKFTFHRATNLPFADLNSLSSDPFIVAQLNTDLPRRHKQDPVLQFRTPTIRKNVNPEWNCEWIVANVPTTGFALKCRLYDEDPADHDDRLGNVHVHVDSIHGGWAGIHEQAFKIKKRMGSKRAYLVRGCAAMLSKGLEMSGSVFISVECLGRTEGNEGGRAYTVGPMHWSQHFSPLMGRLAGVKDPSQQKKKKDGKKTERYNFAANQIQLSGPVPEPLYHRYVEFKPFVAGMFTSHSLRGRILNRALHHQHARIYNYDRSTIYGLFPSPSVDSTKKLLEFVHYDQGGRIFTYVLTLDGQWRFTETGKEFGIDMLSKHTMHSNVSIYIAFSGEFFVRRLKHPHTNPEHSPDPATATLPPVPEPDEVDEPDPSKDPAVYELVIDNDSGTYRPNAQYLPDLKDFMSKNLPGMKVTTLDCQKDEERMNKLKDKQREVKKNQGRQLTYIQGEASDSSISSSDEEGLDAQSGQKRQKSKLGKGIQNVKQPKENIIRALEGGGKEEKHAPTTEDVDTAGKSQGAEESNANSGNVDTKPAEVPNGAAVHRSEGTTTS